MDSPSCVVRQVCGRFPTEGRWLVVCESDRLREGGEGVRFDVGLDLGKRWQRATGFAIRYRGRAIAYLNECQHVPSELDWQPGRFFTADGLYLVCATHGAEYDPASGLCVAGPCRGRSLRRIATHEAAGLVYWSPGAGIHAPSEIPS